MRKEIKYSVCKTITILLLAVSLFFLGCQTNPDHDENDFKKACIDNVIVIDDSLGGVRNHATETESLSQAINDYSNALLSVSFEGCPDSFTDAFQRHIQAWDNMKEVTDNYDQLRGEMHSLFDSLAQSPDSTAFNDHLSKVWSTWSEVEEAMN